MNTRNLYGRQPYVPEGRGELNRDPVSRISQLIAQDNPYTVNRWKMQHGRSLSGLDTESPYQSQYRDDAVSNMESADDTSGSGIFDDSGFTGTINTTLGIFADHPSLPGYVAREKWFTRSAEVKNVSSGAALITVPGGGMSYLEKDGVPAPFYGPTKGKRNKSRFSVTNPGGTISQNAIMSPVPSEQSITPVDGSNISNAATYSMPVGIPTGINPMSGSAGWRQSKGSRCGCMQKSPPPHTWPKFQFGDLPAQAPSAGLGTYVVAGLIVGAAAAIFMGTVKMKGSR